MSTLDPLLTFNGITLNVAYCRESGRFAPDTDEG
jgi:hypothetical protein